MESLSVELTYGKALFEAAEDLKVTDSICKDIEELVSVLKSNPEFFEMLRSPAIDKADKKDSFTKVFSGKLNETLINFVCVLIDKTRIGQFFGIAKEFNKCVNENKGVITGVIYSAIKLPKEKLNKFEKETGTLLRKNVELNNEVDESLIGGVKIYIDGKLIDASLRRGLDDLKEQLIAFGG